MTKYEERLIEVVRTKKDLYIAIYVKNIIGDGEVALSWTGLARQISSKFEHTTPSKVKEVVNRMVSAGLLGMATPITYRFINE